MQIYSICINLKCSNMNSNMLISKYVESVWAEGIGNIEMQALIERQQDYKSIFYSYMYSTTVLLGQFIVRITAFNKENERKRKKWKAKQQVSEII